MSDCNLPFVSLCTPTFNRRPFIPMMLKCFESQTYPKDKIEWIIIDDGTDKIEDLVSHISQIKYFKYDEKMTLGKKRNLMHEKTSGSIIIYIDDDDYYPPERISHSVTTLQNNPTALCAGSSEMYIYFKHIQKMYQFGPYGPNHSTAATFAFRRELLSQTSYDETASLAEEKHFLKNYTIPFVQMDPLKTILVFSHVHNSYDKKELLAQNHDNNPYMKISDKTVDSFVKDESIKTFFLETIDTELEKYEPGSPSNKPDVLKQMKELKIKREKQAEQMQQNIEQKYMEQQKTIQQLTVENTKLKEKIIYYEKKMKDIISSKISDLKKITKNKK